MGDGTDDLTALAHGESTDHLVDPGDALRLLRAKHAERGVMIERYGDTGPAERDIAAEIDTIVPLAQPALFLDAHVRLLHSVEVLDRHGGRSPNLARLGPLRPPAEFIVSRLIRWITRNHQRRLITAMRQLYERQEALTEPHDPQQNHLRRARLHTSRLEANYRGGAMALPAFLVGGAAFSAVASTAEGIVFSLFASSIGALLVCAVLLLVLFGLGWCVLRAAGVARRRIRMTTDAPSTLLWAVIGNCGDPPRDQSYAFAAIAMLLSVISYLAIPAVILLVFGL